MTKVDELLELIEGALRDNDRWRHPPSRVHADEIQPGDVIEYDGRPHRITDVIRRAGWAWPVAADGTGWAMALDRQLVSVSRDAHT